MKIVRITNVFVDGGLFATIGGVTVPFGDVVKMIDEGPVTIIVGNKVFDNQGCDGGRDDNHTTTIELFNEISLAQTKTKTHVVVPNDFHAFEKLLKEVDEAWPNLDGVALCGPLPIGKGKHPFIVTNHKAGRLVKLDNKELIFQTLEYYAMAIRLAIDPILVVEDVFLSTRGPLLKIEGTDDLIPFHGITTFPAEHEFRRSRSGVTFYKGNDAATFLDLYNRRKGEWGCVKVELLGNLADALRNHCEEMEKLMVWHDATREALSLENPGGNLFDHNLEMVKALVWHERKCGVVSLGDLLNGAKSPDEVKVAIANIGPRCLELLEPQIEVLTKVVPTTNSIVIKTFDIERIILEMRGPIVVLQTGEKVPFREFLDQCMFELRRIADDSTHTIMMRLATPNKVSNPCALNEDHDISKIRRADLILTEVWKFVCGSGGVFQTPPTSLMFCDVDHVCQRTIEYFGNVVMLRSVDRERPARLKMETKKEFEFVMHVTKMDPSLLPDRYLVTKDLKTGVILPISEVMEMTK